MEKDSVWEVFHGKDLDHEVDMAHEKLPLGYEVKEVKVSYLNNEYVVTVIAECGE